jgi:restriction endonuclease S subunit
MVRLGEIGKVCMCKRIFKNQTSSNGDIPFYKIGTFGGRADAFISNSLFEEYKKKYPYPKKGEILNSTSGTIGKTVIYDGKPAYFQDSNIVWLSHDEKEVLNSFLNIIYQTINWGTAKGVTIERLYNKIIEETKIPLPPLEVQQEIVAEIEGYQKIIDGCRQVIDAWKPDVETFLDEELKTYLAEHPEKQEELSSGWPMVKLGEVCEINPKKSEVANLNGDITVSFLPMEDIGTVQNILPKKEKKLSEVYKGYTYFKENDVLVAKVTPCFENGKSGIARNLKNGIGFGSSELHVLRPIKEKIVSEYIYPYISSIRFLKEGAKMMTGTGGLQRVPAFFIQEYQIPLPPLEVQSRIVDKIESERKVIDSLREMVKTYEEKIKRVIDKVWGE